MTSLADLETLDGYRHLFTDLNLWTPYVTEVLRRHHLEPAGPLRTGVPGTCPTFLIGERWVVKFFGRLFDGAQAFAVEREAARLIARGAQGQDCIHTVLPIAAPVAAGELGGPGWPWPYLIFPFAHGTRIGDWIEQMPAAEKLRVAGELGAAARCLHGISLEGSPVFANSHAAYRQFLEAQRSGLTERLRAWGSLPGRLIDAVEAFLPPLQDLIDTTRPPHLIHGDLTADHLLGELEDGKWRTAVLIDFGDARSGDLLYELGALHLDLLGGDRALLAAFLDAYGLPPERRRTLPRSALATALLHQFDLFAGYTEIAAQCEGLEALAQRLFGP